MLVVTGNNSLAAVNFFLGLVGIVQCSRIYIYNQSLKKGGVPATLEAAKEDVKGAIKS